MKFKHSASDIHRRFFHPKIEYDDVLQENDPIYVILTEKNNNEFPFHFAY